MDLYEIEKALQDIDDKRYRYQLLIRSLEAKVERIEPNSAEFESTIATIFEYKNKIKALNNEYFSVSGKGNIFSTNT